MQAFFDNLVRELDKVEFLRPVEKRETMLVNLRNIFTRMDPTKQDMHTLHGVVMAIAEGRKGPAKGGVLDGEQATRLRALLAEHAQGTPRRRRAARCAGWRGMLRRNPTDAERILWQSLSRRPPLCRPVQAADPGRPPHSGFCLVSCTGSRSSWSTPTRRRSSSANAPRGRTWLEARGYRVISMTVADVERDLDTELAKVEASLSKEN